MVRPKRVLYRRSSVYRSKVSSYQFSWSDQSLFLFKSGIENRDDETGYCPDSEVSDNTLPSKIYGSGNTPTQKDGRTLWPFRVTKMSKDSGAHSSYHLTGRWPMSMVGPRGSNSTTVGSFTYKSSVPTPLFYNDDTRSGLQVGTDNKRESRSRSNCGLKNRGPSSLQRRGNGTKPRSKVRCWRKQ